MSVCSSPVAARGLVTTVTVTLTARDSILGDAKTSIRQDLGVER